MAKLTAAKAEKGRKLILIPSGQTGEDFWYAIKARAAAEHLEVSEWICQRLSDALRQPPRTRAFTPGHDQAARN